MIPNMRFPGIINTRALLRETEQTSSATLTILDRHTYVTILGHPATGSRRTQVQDGNTIGWVNSNSIEAAQRLGIINAATPLRRDSNRSATTIVRNLPRNHHVIILGHNANGSRTQVRDEHLIGWVNNNSIEAARRQGIVRSTAQLRQRSDTSSLTVHAIRSNEYVTIFGINLTGDRTQVQHENTIGWVSSHLIAHAKREQFIIGSERATFRRGARASADLIRRLPEGTRLIVLGVSTNGERTHVQVGTERGWVRTDRMGLPDLIPVNGMNYRTMNEQQLAQEILNRHHGTSTSGRRITLLVTFEDMNVTNGRSSFGNIRDVAAAKGAMTHWGRRDLSPDLLRAMLRMNDQFGTFQVNTIAGGMHLGGSNDPHARGLAVDIQSTNHIVNGISQTPTAILNHLEGVWNFRTQRNHRGSTYVGSSHHFHLEIWGRN